MNLDSIFSFRETIEALIKDSISSFGPPSILRDAIEYALRNGGKRFRPSLVYLVAAVLGKNRDVSDAALAIEYFHTASLIADDLPSMDDDDQRREHPSLHRAFDEATAILATYALISAGYDRIRIASEKSKSPELCLLAIENASYNTGIFGAAGGQFTDLFPSKLNEESILELIDKKTGTLFEISFVFGWLFGGGDLTLLNEVKRAAISFGRAFQISDDFLDRIDDRKEINYAVVAGIEKAMAVLLSELNVYNTLLKKLRLDSPELLALGKLVEERISHLMAQAPAAITPS